ncbi:MAG: hypothetical protein JST86_12945 [Bacteroidetes bacterium]|nr:hypothetical protein [Bacteroidota bacterium]
MKLIITTMLLLSLLSANGQQPAYDSAARRINVYVISKSEKFEFLPFTVKVRAVIKSVLHHRKMRVVVANCSDVAAAKISRIMQRRDALIGSLWFDSHGLYKNGFSSFSIGIDNFNYKNINDSTHTAFLKCIAQFTDARSKIGIGSCYGGAAFIHPGTATVKSGPMKGDSLMIGMGKIFNNSTVYASGGWVMMKPGIFGDNFGFAGYPLGKRYRTAYWKPVWDHLGEWYSYTATDGFIRNINTVALNHTGTIMVRQRTYLSLNKAVRKQSRALASLQP